MNPPIEKQAIEPEQFVGYQLHLANLIGMATAREALAAHDITPIKVTAMLFVGSHPGCDQTALSRQLLISRAGAMKLVNHLAKRGFMARGSGRDLRSNGLVLTDAGQKILDQALAILKACDDLLCANLTVSERRQLVRLLDKIKDIRKELP